MEHINVPIAHMAVGHCADTCWHLSGTASERQERDHGKAGRHPERKDRAMECRARTAE